MTLISATDAPAAGVPATGTPTPVVPAQALDAHLPLEIVIWAGVIVLALLIVSGTMTLGKSISEYYADRRREAVEQAVRTQLYERIDADNPRSPEDDDESGRDGQSDLESWITSLSETERDVLESQIRDLVGVISGSDRDRLVEMAELLGLREEAVAGIESGNRHERLRGLSTILAFDWTLETEWLADTLGDSRAEREAAIRLLAVQPTEDDRWLGTDLAFAGGQLSIYGVDSLFRLVRTDPAPLLHHLDRGEIEDTELLVQALLVVGHAKTTTGDPPMEGVVRLLDHDSAPVRAEACRALGGYGWRENIRNVVDVGALASDPDPKVRIGIYRTLVEWRDRDAVDQLVEAAQRETDPRAKLTALRGLGDEAAWVLETDLDRKSAARLQPWIDVEGTLQPRRDTVL
ncbi:hypothetical protein AArcSl_0436 [Halalkaliarchaeum desulfuricum]|uniref:Uncharacterized protein n=1 Tax=Halalkaliarchaeum desulfuricum TaxID=2055893 RepID=A0A343TG67_9EURY|nr:HEAT repeat domain-containing protein [Halalkaliarchaeum desulfuricum]AUX08089.1 hypothetical protein AArcSl_0436 [Halalkaliarchaeum desulfuricum]